MKKCCTCHQWLDKTEFNKRQAAWDGLQSRCRKCSRAWYEQKREQHIKNVRRRNDRVREENRDRMRGYLLEHPCVDCGETDLRVLEFDHRPGTTKTGNVTKMAADGLAWKIVAVEIEKCDVRCDNCHRIRTCERAGSWRQVHHSVVHAEIRDPDEENRGVTIVDISVVRLPCGDD